MAGPSTSRGGRELFFGGLVYPYRTTMMAWKYTLPAFLVPFIFTLHPDGIGLLLKGDWGTILWTTLSAGVGLTALAAALTGWFLMKTGWLERVLLLVAGLALLYPERVPDLIGLGLFGTVAVFEIVRRRSIIPGDHRTT